MSTINKIKSNMKSFKDFLYQASELLESSISQSERRRALASRGPGSGTKLKRQRSQTSLKASLRNAGFRRRYLSGTFGAKTQEISHSPEHSTRITRYNNPINYVTTSHNPNFRLDIHGGEESEPHRVKSRKRKLALRSFRRQLRSGKTEKPVYEVKIGEKERESSKNDPFRAFPRAKSFGKETKNIPKSLSSAGASRGSIKIGQPVAMLGGEDEKEGMQRRARLYRNLGTFGKNAKLNPNTGLMVGRITH